MKKGTEKSTRFSVRSIHILLAVMMVMTSTVFTFPVAYADFGSESTDQIIGVGRIQSSTTATSSEDSSSSHIVAPAQLSGGTTEQIAQPLPRQIEDVEGAIYDIGMLQRFGEKDAAGWYTTISSAYGPSSAGTHTAMGTEVTLTSMDVACRVDVMDVMFGRWIEIMYNGIILRVQVTDTGTLAPGRLLDLQPGVCTAFGAPTPEFGWDLKIVKWRFA